jgi:hypothetical protein
MFGFGGRMRRIAALLMFLALAMNACEKKNPNTEPPPPYDGNTVGSHKFDGGSTDPYSKSKDSGGGEAQGGESK